MSNQEVIGQSVEPSETRYFRGDIQGLRALAVILVILAHAQISHFAGGYIGVDVFFVISGYVITGLLLRQPAGQTFRNLGHFYARRIRRIMPAATLVMIATLLFSFHYLGVYSSLPLLTDVRWASLFSANFHFISVGSDYFAQALPKSLITHYWSLAVEEQFYFVFPIVLFGSAAIFGLRKHRAALSTALLVIVTASAIWSGIETHANPTLAYYHPLTRFWEIGFGALIAALPTAVQLRNEILKAVGGWISLAMIFGAALFLTDASPVPGVLTWWAVAPAGFLLWTGGTRSLSSPSGWLSVQPFRYIGDISYSLYLFHYAWLNLPAQYVLLKYSQTTALPLAARLEQIAAALICAVFSYHVLENPIRRSKFLDRRPWITPVLAVLMIGAVWLTAGLVQKYWTL